MFDYFGVDDPAAKTSPRYQQALGRIWDYAKAMAPNGDRDSLLFEVSRLKHRLGSPSAGERPYAKMEMFVKEWQKSREATKRMDELEAQGK